jgi:hypothetical protein
VSRKKEQKRTEKNRKEQKEEKEQSHNQGRLEQRVKRTARQYTSYIVSFSILKWWWDTSAGVLT